MEFAFHSIFWNWASNKYQIIVDIEQEPFLFFKQSVEETHILLISMDIL